MSGIEATAEIDVDASAERVWSALTDPAQIKQYMFGSDVVTDWQPGSSIIWKGEYDGRSYEDRGRIIAIEPRRSLVVTHFSPMSGAEDKPENYHLLSYALEDRGPTTHLVLTQDGNADAEAAQHASDNWSAVLKGLKDVIEQA